VINSQKTISSKAAKAIVSISLFMDKAPLHSTSPQLYPELTN